MRHVKIHLKESLVTWTIDRPERRNALGPTVAKELTEALQVLRKQLTRNTSIRALAIFGAPNPSRVWVGGGDLKELAALKKKDEGRNYAKSLARICRGLEELPIPVVMAIDGAAIGGGVEFALAGDLRLTTSASYFHFKQLEIGLATAFGGARRLVELVGLSPATKWLLLCERLDAEAALTAGLVHEVVPNESVLQRKVYDYAAHFASLSRTAVATQKRMLLGATKLDRTAALAAETSLFTGIWQNPYHKDFLKRFNKKP